MPLPITTLAASALALLLFVVSLRVIFFRRKNRISIGDGGEEELAYRVRAQANLTEYAPIALILIGLAELQDAPFWLLAPLSAVFVVGRLLHAYAFSFGGPQVFAPRVAGMHLTLWPLLGLAALGAWLGIASLL